jgi:hypothetical protein
LDLAYGRIILQLGADRLIVIHSILERQAIVIFLALDLQIRRQRVLGQQRHRLQTSREFLHLAEVVLLQVDVVGLVEGVRNRNHLMAVVSFAVHNVVNRADHTQAVLIVAHLAWRVRTIIKEQTKQNKLYKTKLNKTKQKQHEAN